jgi:hypothetical protein
MRRKSSTSVEVYPADIEELRLGLKVSVAVSLAISVGWVIKLSTLAKMLRALWRKLCAIFSNIKLMEAKMAKSAMLCRCVRWGAALWGLVA